MQNRIEEFFKSNSRRLEMVVLAIITIFYLYLIVLRTLEGGSIFNKTAIIFGSLILFNILFYRKLSILVLSQFYMVIVLTILEILFIVNPSIFPDRFSDLSSKINRYEQSRMVEFLDYAPYAKFRPNTVIRNQGDRGEDFVYQWRSDKFGFKNDPLVYAEPVKAVAIGDSFTECMGCSVADSWPSLLRSEYGINTLNLGVQGYAPQQLIGVLKLYGIKERPEYIIYAYCGTNFYRTAYFDDLQGQEASASLQDASPLFAVELKHKLLDSFTSILLRQVFMAAKAFMSGKEAMPVVINEENKKLNIYSKQIEQDILHSKDMHFSPTMRQWHLTADSIRQAKSLAESIGSELILLHMPHRAYIYYPYLTQRPMPDDYIEREEIVELQKIAKELDIHFIRIDEPLFDYMDGLMARGYDYGDLPYFRKDGHMSPKGTAIVAKSVADYIKGVD